MLTPAAARPQAPPHIIDHMLINHLAGEDPGNPYAPHLFVIDPPLVAGDVITYGDYDTVQTYAVAGPRWVAWLDDAACSRFGHPSRIFVLDDTGGPVVEVAQLATTMPLLINGVAFFADLADLEGPYRHFPDITCLQVDDVDPPGKAAEKCADKFTNAENASSLRIYGNGEESNAGDTKSEIDDTFDKMGIPAANRDNLDFDNTNTPTGQALRNQIENAIRNAAQKGSGPNFVLYLSCHGYNGGLCFNKNDPNTKISWADMLCLICKGLKGTNKTRVLIPCGACYSGGAIQALNNLNCPDCAGIEIGFAAACGANETGKASGGFFGWHPWDFEEELEDEVWCEKDMMEEGEENTAGAAEDIDNPDTQHPEWGHREFQVAAVDLPAVAGLVLAPNRPNPFNPQTVFSFHLAQPARVRVEILDLAGRRVAGLDLGEQPAGWREVTWRARDDEGRPLQSGTYVCRVMAGDQEATGKLTLLK